MILTKKFLPGNELNQERLAAQFHVSRTPIRQALQILAEEGIITLQKNRSAVVNVQTEKNIRDHFELRGMLESKACSYAAQRWADLTRLSELIKEGRQAESSDFQTWQTYNFQFHHEIWRLAESPKLERMILQVWNTPIIREETSESERNAMGNEDHEKIYTAIADRDEELASFLMYRHIVKRNSALFAPEEE